MATIKYLWPVLKHSKLTIQSILKKDLLLPCSTLFQKYSTNAANAEEIVVQGKINLTKPSIVKWKRPPFLKNFFLGKFDIELFVFPEILDKELLSELENTLKNVSHVLQQHSNSLQVENNHSIPDSLLQELKDLGLFGRRIPSKYGGLDLTHTACTRLNEVLGLDWSLFLTIAAHEFLATEAILKFGTDAQKAKYLPKLASGELIAAFCASEPQSGVDLLSMKTTFVKDIDKNFIINGTKHWVTNASRAGVFIVFAKTQSPVDSSINNVSVFIVDKNTEGIKIMKQNKTCLHGLDVGIVQFQNVKVSSSNLLREENVDGREIYFHCLSSFRLAQNSFTFGTLKVLLDTITERIIHTEREDGSLADVPMIRRRLSKINSIIYGMESVSYFTAALLDSTENPDIELESAALKLFNSRGTLYCIREMMDLLGASSVLGEMQLDRFYRDAQGIAMFDAPNDIVKLFLSLNGIKVAGSATADDIKKLRKAHDYPAVNFKAFFKRWRFQLGLKKYDQDLAGHIHPSLTWAGNTLEEKLQVFQLCVENLLADHGSRVVYIQIDPKSLADAATDLYVISAILSRVSRSYCIGLKNSHHELNLANTFVYDANKRLEKHLQSILSGVSSNNEGNHLNAGTQVVDCQGYFAEHPLKHNF